MKCPLNKVPTICKDANGYFRGVMDGSIVMCRCSEYADTFTYAMSAQSLYSPVGIKCEQALYCPALSKEEESECQNGPSLSGPELISS